MVVLLSASPAANAQCCEESADIEHANNTQASEEFGASVAILGNDVVVGAPKHDDGGETNVGRIITFPLDDPSDQDVALACVTVGAPLTGKRTGRERRRA